MSKGPTGTSAPTRRAKAATGSFSPCGASLRGISPAGCVSALAPSPGRKKKKRGVRHGTPSRAAGSIPFWAAAHEGPRGAPAETRKSLPMSELQKASWGWVGEHVHASAPQYPRLQVPRSTTSPSQGVIAAAGATARLSKVAVRAGGGAAAAGAGAPTVRGNSDLGALPSERPQGRIGCGEAASALALDSAGRRWLRVEEREPELELEQQEGEVVREPARCPLCAAARRPSNIALVPPAPPLGVPPLRPIAEPHYLIGPPKRGWGRGRGATGRGLPRPVQILIGNNAALGAGVEALGRASDPRWRGR